MSGATPPNTLAGIVWNFMAALNVGVIRYNDKSRLVKGASGEEFPLMFERDEMKKVVGPLPHDSPIATSTHNIMIDDPYGRLGGDSILRTLLILKKTLVLM